MSRKSYSAVFIIYSCFAWHLDLARGFPDQTPAAITVYRNPKLYDGIDHQLNSLDGHGPSNSLSGDTDENYKYPGETTKPNVSTQSPGVEVTYDTSPEFNPAPRDISVSSITPKKRKGPYSPLRSLDGGLTGNSEETEEFKEFSDVENQEQDANQQESIGRDNTYSNMNNNNNNNNNNNYNNGFFNGPIAQDFTGFNDAYLRFAFPSHSDAYRISSEEDGRRDSYGYDSREIGSRERESGEFSGYHSYREGEGSELDSYRYDAYRDSGIRPVTEDYGEYEERDRESLEVNPYENDEFHGDEDSSRERESLEDDSPRALGDVQMFL